MKRNSLKIIKAATAAILTLSFLFLTAGSSSANIENLVDGDHRAGVYYTMVDENGQVIMRTARVIVVGDEYISSDNNYYRVTSVKGQTAQAELLEKRTLAAPPQPGLWERISSRFRSAVPVQQKGEQKSKKIAIYSSHGAESYIKGDGTESKDPGGGILDVADALQKGLEEKGITVIRSKEPHTPHDAGAYQRSRRTVEEAMKEQPDALIDVHRDAVPEEEYLEEVEGKKRVQVQLVVGRQNQNRANNQQFAEGIKKQADEKFPGLVKGIFMARGNYNQDMSPRATLIEVGSHTNDKAQAEETMYLFSEVVNDFIYGTAEGEQASGRAPTTSKGPGGTALRSVLWIVAGLVAAVAIFLLISTGGFEQMKAKLRQFTGREMADITGARDDEGDRSDGGQEGS
ncbi:MAG: stage II sporulation protein P [Dethiobacteraceae bacterium]|jgi:stage II sporulation protein P|nr:stage II sporulation protein P [Bacillota bacterium]